MEQNMINNNNYIFRYTFSAVLLFIAALGFVIAYQAATIALELSITFMSLVFIAGAISLLYKAIKDHISQVSDI